MPGATVLRCLLLLALSTVAAAQSPVTQDGYVDNRGLKLFYHIVGHSADTVVVIHGGPGFTLDYLAPDLEPLTAHHTLLFYDQRGAGKSTLVGDSAGLTADKFVDDLEAIRRHFHMKKLTLLAHSWGAAVAALYAIRYPDQVSRMIIVGGLPMTGRERDQAFGQLAAKRDSATKQALQKWYEARVRDPGDTVACRAYFHLWFVPLFADSAAVSRSKGDFCAGTPDSRRNKIQSVDKYTLASLGDWDWRPGLRHLQAPVLVIQGTSVIFPEATGREWALSVPNGRLLVLKGAGHFPYLDAPDVFFGAVDEFLKGGWPDGVTRLR